MSRSGYAPSDSCVTPVSMTWDGVDVDVDGENEEKYELARSSGSVTSTSSAVVRFLVTAESLVQHSVILHDDQTSTTDDRHCDEASDCPPHAHVADDGATV